MYKGNARMLLHGSLPQKHFLQELRDIDFAAHTMIALSEIIWEEIMGSRQHRAMHTVMDAVSAGINAGLRFVDANGEAIDAFFARTGTSPGVL